MNAPADGGWLPQEPLAPARYNDIPYDYTPVPTCQEFAASNAQMRGLMGPFGSGKSTACVVEITNRARRQRRGPDGIRHSRWAVIRNCFDDQTEILTELRGWQLFRDLAPDDKVASLHGDALVFELPTMHYAAPYQGEMIGMRSQHIDMLVTPDHHLWSSRRQTRAKVWSEFSHEKARDAYGRTLRRFRTTARWEGGSDTPYDAAFFRFLGFWFAEGYAGAYCYPDRKEPHWRFVVVQKNNLPEVRDILASAGLRWRETISDVSGCTYFRIKVSPALKPLVQELADLGPAIRKRLPAWLRNASVDRLAAFLEGFLLGDGTLGGGSVVTACTSSPHLADDLQEVAIRAGYSATVGSSAVKPRVGSYRSNAPREYRVSLRSPKRTSPTALGWYKADYDGIVYCVEVSTHVVLVRRGGKAHWSGQTYRELSDTTIRTVFSWLPPQHFGRYIENKHSYQIKAIEGCAVEILFLALDRPDDIKNLLSLELTGGWVNEARQVPWPIIEALQGRVGRYPAVKDGGVSWSGVWMDTNPPDSDSKWYGYFEEQNWIKSFRKMQEAGLLPRDMRTDQFARIFKQPSGLSEHAENLPNLPGGRLYYANLAVGKSPEWQKVYIDGEYGFIVEGKLVYPEYSDQIHCKKVDPIEGIVVERTWDFGLTPSVTWSQMLPDGRWLVFDEMVSDNMSVDQFSDEVLEHDARAFKGRASFDDVGDPAGEGRVETDKRSCFDILQAKDIMIRGAMTQDPTLRQESVRKPLRTLVGGEPQFILHPRCKVTRKGFMGGYHRRRMQTAGPERYSDKPEKNEYCVPMHTEALTPSGWKLPPELAPGDAIYGYDIETRRIVITKVRAINIFPGPRLAHHIAGAHSSWTSTPHHRNVVETRAGIQKIVTTADLNEGHQLICAANEERPPKQHPFSDEFISLAAWVMAEGTYRPADDAIVLNQSESHNPAYCAYLDDLVAKFPGTIRHAPVPGRVRGWRITKETAWMLRQWMPGKVPSAAFIARMSNSNRRRFVYEFIRGDGHAGGNLPDPGPLARVRDFRPKGVTPRAFQKLKAAADALQMMSVLSGLRCVVRPHATGHVLTWLTEVDKFGLQERSTERRDEVGVWCPTTATGTWVCRQDGQTFITGNSHPHDCVQYRALEHFAPALVSKPRDPDDDFFVDRSNYGDDPTRDEATGY